MIVKTFDLSYLYDAKEVLKDAFFSENRDEAFNEWEFAENVLKTDGYLPELCLIALEENEVIGYTILTTAAIGKHVGLALGPIGVKTKAQNRGVGSRLVTESIERAKISGYPWIVVLGGDYYARFGFENGRTYQITVSDNDFDNEHLQILFFDNEARNVTSGKLTYCKAFYDAQGNLL